MKYFLALLCISFLAPRANSQDMASAANNFITTLDAAGKLKAVYPFDSEERYNFHFFPKNDRKGISINNLNDAQKAAALALVNTCLSESAIKKAYSITQLENVLKVMENRDAADHYRDAGNYYFAIFGSPGNNTVWGWRIEGHHLSFTFSADKNKLVSGTPAFMGANPAIVRSGPQAGTQVLKEEAGEAFALLHSLSTMQLKKALVDTTAPNEIITFVSRNALIEKPSGIRYAELSAAQQQQLLRLIGVYVRRYTKLFADAMLKEIETDGLENLYFSWAGATRPEIGKAHYYRIQGPGIIIEYDNAQNNANHVHSVLRDLKRDFGGDPLLEHYKAAH